MWSSGRQQSTELHPGGAPLGTKGMRATVQQSLRLSSGSRSEVDEGGGRAVDGALGAGARGQVDAAADAGRDPDDRLDELDVGPSDCLGQLRTVVQAQRPLNVDLLKRKSYVASTPVGPSHPRRLPVRQAAADASSA
ncbi:hypothetical protein ACIBU0_02400 [Streptomyces sp. NPDC049627]|uniref:hypothetical protein n=1 Tax=Streptomyces sp. NPDC049627 TaxID=3365595 RepID=UPI0037AE01D0